MLIQFISKKAVNKLHKLTFLDQLKINRVYIKNLILPKVNFLKFVFRS